MKYFIGIDLGTSGVKSLLMSEAGAVIGTAYRGYDIIKLKVSFAEQDMDVLWEKTVETLQELVRLFPGEASAVEGVSFSGQMHGLIAVDEKGIPLRNAIIWADQRTEKQIEYIYETINADRYKNTIGNAVSTGFLLSSLLWLRENEPDVFARVNCVMFPKDYIRFKMCKEFGTDVSDASGSAIFDISKREWAWDFIDALNIPRSIFPKVSYSAEIAGGITSECSQATGLKKGIAVAFGGGDALIVSVGNGIVSPGLLGVNIGTSAQILTATDTAVYDSKFRTNTFCHAAKDRWLFLGAQLSGGVALKWLKNQILSIDNYKAMDEKAQSAPPGSEGLVFLPYLSGERTPYNNPNARGIFFGLSLKHDNSHMIRSAMEGIVFSLKQSLEIMESVGVEYGKIIASGGGAQSDVFLQMQADILDCEIYTNTVSEQGCMGAAITAAIATGVYKNFEEACSKIVVLSEKVIEPKLENKSLYSDSYNIFKQLYDKNKTLFSAQG